MYEVAVALIVLCAGYLFWKNQKLAREVETVSGWYFKVLRDLTTQGENARLSAEIAMELATELDKLKADLPREMEEPWPGASCECIDCQPTTTK